MIFFAYVAHTKNGRKETDECVLTAAEQAALLAGQPPLVVLTADLQDLGIDASTVDYIDVETGKCDATGYPDKDNPDTKRVYPVAL